MHSPSCQAPNNVTPIAYKLVTSIPTFNTVILRYHLGLIDDLLSSPLDTQSSPPRRKSRVCSELDRYRSTGGAGARIGRGSRIILRTRRRCRRISPASISAGARGESFLFLSSISIGSTVGVVGVAFVILLKIFTRVLAQPQAFPAICQTNLSGQIFCNDSK